MLDLPAPVAEALAELLEGAADGQLALVLRSQDDLSTEQAPAVLGVSRPTVVRLAGGEAPGPDGGNPSPAHARRRAGVPGGVVTAPGQRSRRHDPGRRRARALRVTAVGVAALDANVLVPIVACDFLLTAFDHGLFEPVVSAAVLDEVERTLLEDFPHIDPDGLRRRDGTCASLWPTMSSTRPGWTCRRRSTPRTATSSAPPWRPRQRFS